MSTAPARRAPSPRASVLGSEVLAAVWALIAAGTAGVTASPCPAGGLGPVPAAVEEGLAGGLARLDEGRLVAAPAPAARYWVLAYGARWCAPCRVFTRQVATLLRDGDEARLDYAYVFVSLDRSRAEAARYAREEAMDWLILPPDAAERRPAVLALGARTPPDVVVIDRQTGTIMCHASQRGQYLGARATLERFRRQQTAASPQP